MLCNYSYSWIIRCISKTINLSFEFGAKALDVAPIKTCPSSFINILKSKPEALSGCVLKAILPLSLFEVSLPAKRLIDATLSLFQSALIKPILSKSPVLLELNKSVPCWPVVVSWFIVN